MSQPNPSLPSDSDDYPEVFSEVLSTINMEQLPVLALFVLRKMNPEHAAAQTSPSVGKPMHGGYHIVFPLDFVGGLRWVAKFPVNGTQSKWDASSASDLSSEANTMRLLRRETTIPIPDVFDFSATTNNPLQCPYILMSYVDGVPLSDVWFGRHRLTGASPEATRTRRIRALEGIASAMAQLGKYSFRACGSPLFDGRGKLSRLGSINMIDQKAMFDRWYKHGDPSNDLICFDFASTSDPKAFYTIMVDKYPEEDPTNKGIQMLLKQLVDWLPEHGGIDRFVLAHPDIGIQNFIVSEEGELRGIIDWNGVVAVPRSIGNEAYPGWLTCDWDPAMYGYKESMERNMDAGRAPADSPATLAYYRSIYNRMMARYRPRGLMNFTRMSLIAQSLEIASGNRQCRNAIVDKMVNEIWSAGGGIPDEEDFVTIGLMFSEGGMEASVLETLRRGFNILLGKEGL